MLNYTSKKSYDRLINAIRTERLLSDIQKYANQKTQTDTSINQSGRNIQCIKLSITIPCEVLKKYSTT